jgi:TBC1 domain family member 2
MLAHAIAALTIACATCSLPVVPCCAPAFCADCGRACRVQDVYTAGQPGVQRVLAQLEELVARVDGPLARHFADQGLSFFQFAFRWVNCMLIREVPFEVSIRLWDTYLAEGMHFSEFLPYACAAFLLFWSRRLLAMDFQNMILFLQKVPTGAWSCQNLEGVLSHAHMLRASFGEAQSHFAV